MASLTTKEQAALDFLFANALSAMGGKTKEDLLADNFSWFNISDLMEGLSLNRHEAAGIMSALDMKAMAVDSEAGSKVRYDRDTWYITDAGIEAANLPMSAAA